MDQTNLSIESTKYTSSKKHKKRVQQQCLDLSKLQDKFSFKEGEKLVQKIGLFTIY